MIFNKEIEIEALRNKRKFCVTAIAKYNKKLPKKLLMAFLVGVVYAFVRINIDRKEKISFYTTLTLIVLFCFIVILVAHFRLIEKIKKDIKEIDEQIKWIESQD